MADTKLSALPAAGAFADADILYITQGGVSVKTTWGAVKAAILLAKYPEVANYAALPAAAGHTGETYVCLAAQGVYFINRKPAGFYYSNGVTWSHVGDMPEDYFTDSILQISDDGDPTKILKFQLSGLTTATTRTVTWQDKDGTVMLLADIHDASSKATPVDADELGLIDSAASNVLKKLTWANTKATLKTYFDTIYSAVSDTAFASSWDGVTNAAPTKNAVWDQLSEPPLIYFVAQTFTNLPASVGFWAGSSGHQFVLKVDLTNKTQVKFLVNKQSVAGAAGSKVVLRYNSSLSTTASAYSDIGTSAVEVAVDTGTVQVLDTGWINLAAGAKAVVYVAPMGYGGDGVTDPSFGIVAAQFR